MTFKYKPGQRVQVIDNAESTPYVDLVMHKFGDPRGKTGFVMECRKGVHGTTANWYRLDCFGAWLHERVLSLVPDQRPELSTWDQFRVVMRAHGEELDPSKTPNYIPRR